MKQENKQELYTSPKVKVREVKARQVICQSTTVEQEKLEGFTEFEW